MRILETNKKLRVGLVGPGFIAAHHIDAVRRLKDVEIVGIAGSSLSASVAKAREFDIERAYSSYEELMKDPDIDVVHNTTPTYMHHTVSMAAIRAGKHIISDKPLAQTPQECADLFIAAEVAGLVNAVTFNYRGNPLVQEAREMTRAGKLGDVSFVHGKYLQDWMTDPRVYSWRLDPALGGPSSALSDIGSHWCDLAEHITGKKIVAVLCEMTTVVKTRFRSSQSSPALSSEISRDGSIPIQITSEDLAVVLLRFDNGAIGTFAVGQVLPGHKNDLQIEINGTQSSLAWRQETQNDLWIGHYGRGNVTIAKDPKLMDPVARPYAHLPGGHQEGWPDAFFNVISDIYSAIRAGNRHNARRSTICTFRNAYRSACIIDAILRSSALGGVWTNVEESRWIPAASNERADLPNVAYS